MILDRVKKTIDDYKLLQRRDKILLAYSGGADSTALLHLLLSLRQEWALELFLAHFNHKLRSRAEEDEKFARLVADRHRLPLFVGSEDVRSYARVERMNIEEAGRRLRYDFLKRTAFELGGAKIATGHTMTDQAETFLIRLLRGSGLRGLAGIYPTLEGKIIRPLIQVERREAEAFLKERSIEFCVDESNFDRRYLRNRIRHELLPFLEENFEPRIVPHLSRLASIIQDEEDLLEKMTREAWPKAVVEKNSQLALDLKSLSSLPHALARRVVRDFILKLRGSLRDVSFHDVESLLNLGEGKEHPLKRGLILRRDKGTIFLKAKTVPVKYEHSWKGEEPLEIEEVSLKFEGKKIKKDVSLPLDYDDRGRAFLDFGKLDFPLLVRNRREGDRYQPLGAPGRQKVKEIMRAKGIALSERGRVPVFLSAGRIVWILGLPVSEKFKVDSQTAVIFEIRLCR